MSSDILVLSNNLINIQKNDKNYKKTYNISNNNLINNNKEDKCQSESNIPIPLEKSKTDIINKKIKQLDNNKDIISKKTNSLVKKINGSENSDYSQSIDKNKRSNMNNNNNEKNDKNSNMDISFSIITLDIDGNVNLYQNGEEVTLFNLYDFKDISQKMKNDKFFSMGY